MDNKSVKDPLVYRRILLTVDEDDNESTTRAFRFAITLAHDYDAVLGIVSVMESEDINIFDSLTPSKIKEKRDELKKVVSNYVDTAEENGLRRVEPLAYEGGDVDDVILERVIPDFKPDLIVTGADTQFPHSKIAGAIGPRLAKRADVSVIVVR
ncbi:universal stress protein [Companilactobacillus nuruki]|uniref:Universal stress protein UspA n=1 Tax=Companilactobacillus nuruki TaxID=1993540 RepID=A0A2N7AT84_9LACO|nr:universal stress protein [Companilactobacillus nuruki]PMD69064.1 universal stress protein UspA [Companilactobacillus nuruki]